MYTIKWHIVDFMLLLGCIISSQTTKTRTRDQPISLANWIEIKMLQTMLESNDVCEIITASPEQDTVKQTITTTWNLTIGTTKTQQWQWNHKNQMFAINELQFCTNTHWNRWDRDRDKEKYAFDFNLVRFVIYFLHIDINFVCSWHTPHTHHEHRKAASEAK